jgi:hypothetical protein
VIVTLPEAKNYIEGREAKQKDASRTIPSSFSLEKGSFDNLELEGRFSSTLARQTDLTPRFVALLEILLSDDRVFDREEIKQELLSRGIGGDIGQAGRYLSNLSQFLTKRSNPHLRQVIELETGGEQGEIKDKYRIVPKYRQLVSQAVSRWRSENAVVNGEGVGAIPAPG